MTFRPFGAKHLSEIERADLEALISDAVPEGLFVEYKSEWGSEKARSRKSRPSRIARVEGWLVVGMLARGLLPSELVGI